MVGDSESSRRVGGGAKSGGGGRGGEGGGLGWKLSLRRWLL